MWFMILWQISSDNYWHNIFRTFSFVQNKNCTPTQYLLSSCKHKYRAIGLIFNISTIFQCIQNQWPEKTVKYPSSKNIDTRARKYLEYRHDIFDWISFNVPELCNPEKKTREMLSTIFIRQSTVVEKS